MNNQMNHIASKLSCGLLGGVSMLALGLASPAVAQETQQMETIIVTGQRAAIENAIRIKENADQIVDSIVADDAGKLPDRSITEVLQRVSGVTITHFNNPGSPDDYTVEGSGPSVRGLPGGTSTINGHNAFSANGGRNILWGDVPSELMAAVDVFKTYTPDQIEGGLGGTINLRTHLPFDFDGTKFGARIGASYGDLIKQARPVGSAMISTRWNTSIGEMGLLVDVSYDDDSYRNDSIQVGTYFPHTNVIDNYSLTYTAGVPTGVALTGNKTYWLPGGFDYHTTFASHQRGGASVAYQWRPSDKLIIEARAFSSVNQTRSTNYSYSADAGSEWANITYVPDPTSSSSTQGLGQVFGALNSPAPTSTDPLYHVWDSGNYLMKSNSYVNPQDVNSCTQPNALCSSAITRSQVSKQFSRTTDAELAANWTPNDQWQVRTAVDFIYSKSNFTSLQVEGRAIMPNYGVDLSGTYPTFIFSDASALRTSSSYYWNDTMKDKNKNYGQEIQANVDLTYHLNRGIFKDIKFGWRGDVRTEHDHDTGYFWQQLSPNWTSPQNYWSSPASTKDTILYQFPNFFRGEVNLPGQALFVDPKKIAMLSDAYFQNQYNNCHNGDVTDCSSQSTYTGKDFTPYDAKQFKTVNVAAYAMATFAKDSVFGMPLSGNAGVRLVYVDNQASGYFTASGNSKFRFTADGPLWATDTNNVPIAGGRVSWTVLPAFNVQVMPTDQIHVRLAGSVTAQQPNLAGIYGSYYVSTQTNNAGPSSPLYAPPNAAYDAAHPKTVNVVNTFNFEGDNPRIKPEIGRNLDLSFEWYGSGNADSAHISLFYKSIKHKTTTSYEMRNLAWNIGIPDPNSAADDCVQVNYLCQFTANGSQNVIEPTVTKTTVNSNKEAVIRGVEIGFSKYFDWEFVPSYLKGFGFAGNYTYIDSKSPGSRSLDLFGTNIASRLPIEGLSHHSYNAQFMYDRDPVSFRLAYNWRSKYLLLASGYNTAGSYQGANAGITCHQNNNEAGGWGGNLQEGYCYYALPVWSKSFGSLDAGMDYSIDENWKLSVQSQNLLNTKAKTTMGINMAAYTDATGVNRPAQQERSRNWFVADRRVSIDLRLNY